MAELLMCTADPVTQTIRDNLLPDYLRQEVIGGSLANTVTVTQTVNGVIPNRPTSSTAVSVIWLCWDNPGAKALSIDTWHQVAAP